MPPAPNTHTPHVEMLRTCHQHPTHTTSENAQEYLRKCLGLLKTELLRILGKCIRIPTKCSGIPGECLRILRNAQEHLGHAQEYLRFAQAYLGNSYEYIATPCGYAEHVWEYLGHAQDMSPAPSTHTTRENAQEYIRKCLGIQKNKNNLEMLRNTQELHRKCLGLPRKCSGILRRCLGILRRCLGIPRRCLDTCTAQGCPLQVSSTPQAGSPLQLRWPRVPRADFNSLPVLSGLYVQHKACVLSGSCSTMRRAFITRKRQNCAKTTSHTAPTHIYLKKPEP